MTQHIRDIRTLLILPRRQGKEELRIKFCESQSTHGLRLFVDFQLYAPTETGTLAPTNQRVHIHSHEVDEVINALEVALEEISRAKYTIRPKSG